MKGPRAIAVAATFACAFAAFINHVEAQAGQKIAGAMPRS